MGSNGHQRLPLNVNVSVIVIVSLYGIEKVTVKPFPIPLVYEVVTGIV